jgi:hypothetical protein
MRLDRIHTVGPDQIISEHGQHGVYLPRVKAIVDAFKDRDVEDGANVVFIGSATEDPERGPAKAFGLRAGRYISVEVSVRGEWRPGGTVARSPSRLPPVRCPAGCGSSGLLQRRLAGT